MLSGVVKAATKTDDIKIDIRFVSSPHGSFEVSNDEQQISDSFAAKEQLSEVV